MEQVLNTETSGVDTAIGDIKTKVDAFCDAIINSVPSKFEVLTNCGFFTKGMNSITELSNNLKANAASFSQGVTSHDATLTASENSGATAVGNLPSFMAPIILP